MITGAHRMAKEEKLGDTTCHSQAARCYPNPFPNTGLSSTVNKSRRVWTNVFRKDSSFVSHFIGLSKRTICYKRNFRVHTFPAPSTVGWTSCSLARNRVDRCPAVRIYTLACVYELRSCWLWSKLGSWGMLSRFWDRTNLPTNVRLLFWCQNIYLKQGWRKLTCVLDWYTTSRTRSCRTHNTGISRFAYWRLRTRP